ncbi:MAG: hypothetical protein ACXIVG_15410 [Pararhodobacter sp.]
MIILAGLIIGAVWGVLHARRRNGSRLDMVQYGAVWGIIGGLLGVAATIGVERLLF